MTATRPLILNVNDRTAMRYLVSQMLQRSGFDVLEAETGQEALDRATEHPDAIVLDVKLPDIDGYEVVRKLKAEPRTNGIPVLLTSASFNSPKHRVEGLDSGADAYLTQPFEAMELSATLRALLRIRAAEREATEALRLRDDFISAASHELKTPLTALSLQAQSLEKLSASGRLTELPRESVQTKLGMINRQARFLSKLVEDLLDVSRIRAGRFELTPEQVDLADAARQVAERLGADLQRYGCPIQLIAPEPVVGSWDRTRIEQVVSNLLTNACKYGEGRPVEVTVFAEPHGLAVLKVKDFGRGIAPADQERIFGRFERAATDPNRPGLGLGLWIVREIVAASGGDISVESEPGRGATFTVRLRREIAARTPQGHAASLS